MEVRVELIKTVVSQVNIFLLHQVATLTLIVLLCCKAGQSILVDIDTQRIDRCEGNIDSEIELVTIDQERLAHVLAHNHGRTLWNFIDVLSDKDAFTLRRRGWLTDPSCLRLRCHAVLELNHFVRQNEREREEFEVAGTVSFTQSSQVAIHLVLTSHLCTLREVVNLLVAVHALVDLHLDVG